MHSLRRSTAPLLRPLGCALVALVVPMLAAFPAAAGTPSDGDLLSGFNAITSGNFSSSADSEGPILVGGNLSGSATVMSLGASLPAGLSGFGSINVIGNTAGASYNANNLTVKVGTANQGATFSGATSVTYGAAWPTPFNTMWQQLTTLSATLSLLKSTAGSSLSGSAFTAGAATVDGVSNVAVLNITAAQLESVGNPTMTLGSASIFIINVDTSGTGGKYTPAGGTNFNGQAYAGNVLWNFYNASSIGITTEFGGSILAPGAAVSNTGPIDGSVVAASFAGNGEIHYKPMSTTGINLVNAASTTGAAVPEPGSIFLLLGGVAGLARALRRVA